MQLASDPLALALLDRECHLRACTLLGFEPFQHCVEGGRQPADVAPGVGKLDPTPGLSGSTRPIVSIRDRNGRNVCRKKTRLSASMVMKPTSRMSSWSKAIGTDTVTGAIASRSVAVPRTAASTRKTRQNNGNERNRPRTLFLIRGLASSPEATLKLARRSSGPDVGWPRVNMGQR